MKIPYRPEIDGLRAIAVLAVIFYHAEIEFGNVHLFKGGFLGVDVFFVISGFLITSIILTEFKRTHHFSITNFYTRRIRRLLPALFTVIIVSMPFAWNLLLPQQLVDFSKSILNSLAFISNFYWNHEVQQYDAESALLQPFLHTWSLAVEEQFYIFYPIILMLIYRWKKTEITIIFTLLTILSLLFSQYMTVENASFSFYMFPTRIWELLSGGLLAVYLNANLMKNSAFSQYMPTLGFLMIICSIVFISFNVLHPGFITLIPIIGTVLIILFASSNDIVTKALSSKLMVGIGLISYSLYLWHYPIFAFGRFLTATPTWFDKSCWILLSLILSMVTFRFVEQPFRDKSFSAKKMLIFLSVILLIIASINTIWIKNNGFGERLGFFNSVIKQSKPIWVSQDGKRCHSGGRGTQPNFPLKESCVFNYSSEYKNIILVGDSHAASLSEDVRKLAKINGYNFIQLSDAGCQHVKGFHKGTCRQRSNNLVSYLNQYSNSIVIYSARVPLFLEEIKYIGDQGEKEAGYKYIPEEEINSQFPKKAKALIDTLNEIKNTNDKLVIVYPIPEQGFHLKDKLFREIRYSQNKEKLPIVTTSYQNYLDRVFRSYRVLDSVLGGNVFRVFPEKIFCSSESGRCIVSENEKLYYEKDNHVSPIGSNLIVTEIAKVLSLKRPHK